MRKLLKKAFKKLNKSKYYKIYILGSILVILMSLSYLLLGSSFGKKANASISEAGEEVDAMFENVNPEFKVAFGSKSNPKEQRIRFEATPNEDNPYSEQTTAEIKQGNLEKIKEKIFKPNELGIELSLKRAEVRDFNPKQIETPIENLDEQPDEKSVSNPLDLTDFQKEIIEELNRQLEEIAQKQSEVSHNLDNLKSEVSEIVSESQEVYTQTEVIQKEKIINTGYDISTTDSNQVDTVINREVVSGVDIEYQIIEGIGLKEEIVIKRSDINQVDCIQQVTESGSVKDICSIPSNSYTFELALDPGVKLNMSLGSTNHHPTGSYFFTDKYGRYLYHLLPSYAVDANGVKTNNVKVSINPISVSDSHLEKSIYEITVTLNLQWLLETNRAFPVVIDPSIVHDTEAEFDGGSILSRVISGSGPEVYLTEQQLYSDIYTLGLWHMDEGSENSCSSGKDICDASGNTNDGTFNNGTTFSSAVALGNTQYSISFDGTDDDVTLSNIYLGSRWTIEAWVNRSSGSGTKTIVDLNDDTNYCSLRIGESTTDYVSATCSGSLSLLGTSSVSDNKWHHVALVRDGSVAYLYVDGDVQATNYSFTTTYFTSTNSRIGRRYFGAAYSYPFDGNIDELKISNVARSPEEIKASSGNRFYGLYVSDSLNLTANIGAPGASIDNITWTEDQVRTGNGETPYSTNNLLAQWNFNETNGTTASSSAGSCGTTCNGTLTNMTTTGQDTSPGDGWTYNNRKWGSGALMFDGVDAGVLLGTNRLGALINGSSQVTVAAWVKATKMPGGTSRGEIVSIQIADASEGVVLEFYGTSSVRVLARSVNSDSLQTLAQTIDNPYKWHYYVAIVDYENDTIHLYIDGDLARTESVSFTNTTFTNGSVTYSDAIGCLATTTPNTYFLKGIVDSVSIYTRALPANEVVSNYNATDIEVQTSTSSDGITWEDWKPITSESQLSDMTTSDITCTGGNSIDGDTHIFTSSGVFSCPSDVLVNVLVVAGGGAGGSHVTRSTATATGAGGGGGVVYRSNVSVPAGATSTVVIGAGGVSPATQGQGGNGEDSSFGGIVATGGGGGGFRDIVNGKDGGSGGGAGYQGIGGSGSTGQGNNGGNVTSSGYGGGGGGGAGEIGASTAGHNGANGGDGRYFESMFGTTYGENGWFGGGGGGGARDGYSGGSGGIGGGGDGTGNGDGLSGTDGTGGGGGGGGDTGWKGGDGGDGIVMVKVIRSLEVDKAYDSTISLSSSSSPTKEGNEALRINTGPLKLDIDTVGLWHLDETNGDNAGGDVFDESDNNNDGEFYGTNISTAIENGVAGKSRRFNGSDDFIEITDSASLEFGDGGSFTLEAWIKPDNAAASVDEGIITKFDTGADNRSIALLRTTSEALEFYIDSNGTSGIECSMDGETAGKLADTEWHYVVGVFDDNGNKMYTYIDGLLDDDITCSVNPESNTSNWVIGNTLNNGSDGGNDFDGLIDEVRISNTAHSAERISEVYKRGKGYRITKTISPSNVSSNTKIPFWIASNRPSTTLEVTTGESNYSNNIPDKNTVGLWHLEEKVGTGAYIKDSTFNGLNGTPTGTDFAPGKLGGGRNFDGSNDYITIPNNTNLNITDNLTLEAWIKPRSMDSIGAWDRIIEKGSNTQYGLALTSYQGIGVVFQMYIGGAIRRLYSNIVPDLDSWTYVVGTYDGSQVKIYMNGQLVSNSSYSGSIATTSSNLVIGDLIEHTRKFDGIIDEVRISNTSRTAEEIRQAFEVGLRTHPITIDFGASLDSGGTGGLITSGSDLAFTIDATLYGTTNKGDHLYEGDAIIVKEIVDSTEYIAQGNVMSVTTDGEVEVQSWSTGSTFPSEGFTSNADVFKWQEEFVDISKNLLSTDLDALTDISFKILGDTVGADIWIDDIKTAKFLTDPSTTDNISSTTNQYIKYKAILTTTKLDLTPYLTEVTLNYTPAPFTNEIMRHGKWFWGTDGKQNFWWAR